MCLELYLLLIDYLVRFQLGPEPHVLHVALGNKYKALMGTLIHGAQLVNQLYWCILSVGHINIPILWDTMESPIQPSSNTCFNTSAGVCLSSNHKAATPVQFQLSSTLEIVTMPG